MTLALAAVALAGAITVWLRLHHLQATLDDLTARHDALQQEQR